LEALSRVDDLQPKHLFECIEITVAMEEFVTGEQAEGSNPAINRLADGETALPQSAVIQGGGDCKIGPSSGEYLEFHQIISHPIKIRFVSNAL